MRAFYGSKDHIKKYLEVYLSQNRMQEISLPIESDSITDMPTCICDVTIPLRFVLEPNTGLVLEKMNTKDSVFGFFNPIPPFMLNHSHPILCIIFTKPME